MTQQRLVAALKRLEAKPIVYIPDIQITDIAWRPEALAERICPLMEEPIPEVVVAQDLPPAVEAATGKMLATAG